MWHLQEKLSLGSVTKINFTMTEKWIKKNKGPYACVLSTLTSFLAVDGYMLLYWTKSKISLYLSDILCQLQQC